MIQFLPEELFVLVIATYVLGMILKKIDLVDDRYIIIFISIFAVSCTMTMRGLNVESLLLGIIAAGLSVLGNQTVKQLTKKENKEGEERK